MKQSRVKSDAKNRATLLQRVTHRTDAFVRQRNVDDRVGVPQGQQPHLRQGDGGHVPLSPPAISPSWRTKVAICDRPLYGLIKQDNAFSLQLRLQRFRNLTDTKEPI